MKLERHETLSFDDMIRFKNELEPVYETVAGVAEFKTIENQLYGTFSLRRYVPPARQDR